MRHIVDHPRAAKVGRVLNFVRIARAARGTWHRSETKASNTRIVQFCRIARGQTV